MNKKNKIDRHPIPDDTCRTYMGMVWTLAKVMGIDKIPSAVHYLQLHCDEINRHIFEQKSPAVTHHREDCERRKYIAIFRTKYLELTDLEYNKAITPVEAKMVSQVCDNLAEKGLTVDEYLKWMFDEFLPTAEKFCPPQLRWSCSDFIISKFFYENRDLLKQRKEEAIRSKLSVDLMNRARVCMRQVKPEDIEKIKEMIKKFFDGGIVIDEMRKLVESYEAAIKQENSGQMEATNGN
jgi:hypothetical protein